MYVKAITVCFGCHIFVLVCGELCIRVITKLPNPEQSYKGKVKTHKYINRQNQSTTGKLSKRNDSDLVKAFLKKWWVESDSHYILGYNYNMHKPAQ